MLYESHFLVPKEVCVCVLSTAVANILPFTYNFYSLVRTFTSLGLFFFFNFYLLFIYLFYYFFKKIFGCVGSSFLCEGFLQLR